MGTIKEHEEKNKVFSIKYQTGLNKVISIENIDDTKILIDTDDKLPVCTTLKCFVIIMTSVVKDDGKFYPQLFLEKSLYDEQPKCKALKKQMKFNPCSVASYKMMQLVLARRKEYLLH